MLKKIKKAATPINTGLFIVAVITFAPFFDIDFATNDDFVYFFTSHYNWLDCAYIGAIDQGRFFFFFTSFFFNIPYLFDFELWKRAFQFIPIIFILIGFFNIIKIHFEKKKIANFYLLLYLIFFQITNYYNAFISYHFYFTISFASLIWSYVFLNKYFADIKKKNLYFSISLFAFGILFYELYLIYFLFFLVFIYSKANTDSFFGKLKFTFKKSRGFLLVILFYTISFIIFRLIFPSNYEGNQISDNFSFSVYFNTAIKLINGALPLNNFFSYISFFQEKSIDYNGFSKSNFFFSEILSISNWIKILLIFLIIYKTLSSFRKVSNKKIYISLITGLLLLILPAFTIALGKKYMIYQPEHYTITVFQFFGSVMFLMGLFILIDKSLRKYKILQYTARIILGFFITFSSLAHDYANNMFAFDIKQSQVKFKVIDYFMKSDYYSSIETDAIIYAPTLWNNTAYEAKDVTKFGFGWAEYSKIRHHRERSIVKKNEDFIEILRADTLQNGLKPIYTVLLKQSYKTNDILLVASKTDTNIIKNNIAYTDTAQVYIYSVNKSAIISYETTDVRSDSIQLPKYQQLKTKNYNKNIIWEVELIDKNINLQSINLIFLE